MTATVLGRPFSRVRPCEHELAWIQDEERAHQERAARQRREQLRDASGMRGWLLDARFGTVGEGQPEALREAREFAAEAALGGWRVLLLHSEEVGTGKTALAAAIAHYCIDRERSVCFVRAADLLHTLRKELLYEFAREADDLWRAARESDLLVLDDVGQEPCEGRDHARLYAILDARYVARLPVVITTNVAQAELKEYLGSALTSRIFEGARAAALGPRDIRKARGKGKTTHATR